MAYNASATLAIPSLTPGALLYSFPYSSFLYNKAFTWIYTTAAVLVSLLVLEQVVYRYKKGILPGDAWTIPLIGKFANSMNPTMEGYLKQWDLGDLSALSVFNMSDLQISISIYFMLTLVQVLSSWHPPTNFLARF